MRKIVLVGNSSLSMVFFRKGLILKLIELGYDVHVLAPSDYKTEELKSTGCTYHETKIKSQSTNPVNDFLIFWQFFRLYKTIRPEFIIHYTIKPNIYGTIAARLQGIPSIAVTTGLGYAFVAQNWINKVVKLMYRSAFRFSDNVWFLNTDDLNIFLNEKLIGPDKAFLLPGEGVNTAFYKPTVEPSAPPFKLLLIARVIWDKGIKEYIEASKLINEQFPGKVFFQLLGPTDADNPAAVSGETVKQWHDEGIIEYLGVSSNVVNEISQAHCVVLPTYYREGVPKVLMEAAAMEKPLIATDVAGCREVIANGINGYLCEPRSSQSLADQILKMISLSASERSKMGKEGRRMMIERFDEQKIIGIYIDYINEQLGI